MKRVIRNFLFSSLSATTWLIVLNTIFFIFAIVLGFFIPNFFDYIALKPAAILQGKNLWTLVTHMFMHASFLHLFFNMFSLYFIGKFLERVIGRKRFVWFYVVSGLFAGIFFTIGSGFLGYGQFVGVFGDPNVAGVGASGAIFGLIGVLAVLTPRNRVYLIAGPLVAIILSAIVNNSVVSLLANVYIIVSIFAIFSFSNFRKFALPLEMPFWMLPIIAIVPLIVIGLFTTLPIANTAHLGGLLAGLAYGFYLRTRYKRKVRMLDRMFR